MNLNLPSFYLHLPILIVVISLVYSATRFEYWDNILKEAFRWGFRMLSFLCGIGIFLYLYLMLPLMYFLLTDAVLGLAFVLYCIIVDRLKRHT